MTPGPPRSTGAASWPASARRPRCRTTAGPPRGPRPAPAPGCRSGSARNRRAGSRSSPVGTGSPLNTLVQGAWALLLSRWSGEREVQLGTTVSGRPADLPGADTVTGLFITISARPGCGRRRGPLRRLAARGAGGAGRGPPARPPALNALHGLSRPPAGTPLFDSLVVFENYPVGDATAGAHGLALRDLDAREATNYPSPSSSRPVTGSPSNSATTRGTSTRPPPPPGRAAADTLHALVAS